MQPTKCNVCGKEFLKEDIYEDFKIEHDFGYHSKRDGDKLKLNACCECEEIIVMYLENMCTLNPIEYDYDGGGVY